MRRAELRLVVNAGSLLEENDQQGLAHFVEHMAFNGTKNFPKSDIVTFMESIGMRFGPSVNAFTSFDETVYMLQIPTDKAEVIDRVAADPRGLGAQRHLRSGRDRQGARRHHGGVAAAARRAGAHAGPAVPGAARRDRATRSACPSARPDILQTFKPERLKQFYADWYRPDLMAVIAVGDFDKAAMEGLIKKHFAGLPAASKPKPRPVYDVPKQPGTLYSIVTDPEAPMTVVSAYSKMPVRDQSTVGAYRQMIVERLFSSMLSARLGELAQKPDAPFMAAGADRGIFVKSAEASTLSAMAKDDAIDKRWRCCCRKPSA